MSKGIGQSYIQRMKRYHVPTKIRDPKVRISVVCDRAFYHDGAFKYKLPRYYRDRLYRKKFPCDTQVWNNKLKLYEKKIVYRFKSKNPLALQMQAEVRSRVLAQYNKRVAELKERFPYFSDTQIHLEIQRLEARVRETRFKDNFAKCAKFYNSQRFKQPKF